MTRTAEAAGTTGVLAYDLNIKDIEQEFFEKNGYRWVASSGRLCIDRLIQPRIDKTESSYGGTIEADRPM